MSPPGYAGRLLRRAALRHRAWRYRLRVDPDEIRWMLAALRPGDTAVDAGAYKGGYTFWMRKAVGAAGHVLAFEPQPPLASYLRGCVDAFAWTNVRVDEAALSSEVGRRDLHVPADEPSPGASLVGASLPRGAARYPVRVDTLDRTLDEARFPRPVRLLKCDVEGHELDLFEGARRTLLADQPLLLFECEARHDPTRTVEDVFAYLGALGYAGFFFWKGERLGVDRFDAEVHQVQGRRPYGNNFVFVPEGRRSGRAP